MFSEHLTVEKSVACVTVCVFVRWGETGVRDEGTEEGRREMGERWERSDEAGKRQGSGNCMYLVHVCSIRNSSINMEF